MKYAQFPLLAYVMYHGNRPILTQLPQRSSAIGHWVITHTTALSH